MSFQASNNRIFMTNAQGKVIFDTNKPMPHIIHSVNGTVGVAFPKIPCTYYDGAQNYGPSIVCERSEYQCNTEWVCRTEWEWVYENDQWVSKPVEKCGWEQVCSWEPVRYDEWRHWQGFDYEASDWQLTRSLGPVPEGLNADFLIVHATATRTRHGALADMGALPCGLPLGKPFLANNSSIIECMSDIRNGTPWMTRVMSVFVENGEIKVQFKHSNRGFRAVSQWDGLYCSFDNIPPRIGGIPETPPQGDSAFNFNLSVRLGMFTI
ncbi:hypothetical protein RZ532_22290 [Nitratireductor aquimarinus]|uniref:hypothetical protein n=1 Tax=Nitratireductor aquimarinus TaxID=889300 RepID=UPI002935E001|nr:hypothetical protein [Nitratireductor aquimarinus]MDV2968722.1 hypothetical protein [Nitratireductor aquimarinus]